VNPRTWNVPRLGDSRGTDEGATSINCDKMTVKELSAVLAERVMKWRVAPDRFLLDGRRWLPRWRFQPAEKIEDAFRLLEALDPGEYDMAGRGADNFCVRIRLENGGVGEASDKSKARAITYAVARAMGVDAT
jgi:hypothetical protein